MIDLLVGFLVLCLIGLAGFGCWTFYKSVIGKGKTVAEDSGIDEGDTREKSIPYSTHLMSTKLQTRFKDEISREKFHHLVKKMISYYHAAYQPQATEMLNDFDIFNPQRKYVNVALSQEEIETKQNRFLKLWKRMLRKANFKHLSEKEFSFAMQENYLTTIPIEVAFDKFDPSLFTAYNNRKKSSRRSSGSIRGSTSGSSLSKKTKKPPASFNDKIWVFRRGIGVDSTTGAFALEKVNFLITAFSTGVWNRVAKLLGKPPIVPPKPIVTSVGAVKRITLRNILLDMQSFSWRSLIEKVTLQEPTFRDIVLLYRPKDPPEENKHAIFIKTFRDVPMADLEIVFPERRIGLEPVDLLKFTITGCIGIITAIINLRTEAGGGAVGLAFIGTFLALASKVVFDYNTSLEHYRNLLNQSLYERSLNNHSGAIVYMMEQLKSQEIKESVLAYGILLQHGKADAGTLDRLCEEFLAELGGNSEKPIDFDVPDALHKLVSLGVVTREGNMYTAVPLDAALESVKSKWKKLFHQT